MKLTFQAYTLHLKDTFTLATHSRSHTPVIMTQIEYQGFIGYGEASMPPYLGESHQTATLFLSQVNLKQFNSPHDIAKIMSYVDSITQNNCAAKAAIDIALHDLVGKIENKPRHEIRGLSLKDIPTTSYTIGIDTEEIIRKKVQAAQGFKLLKVKLGRNNDKEIINTIRSCTDVPLCVDINQGRTDKEEALQMIKRLAENGVIYIEQPMPKEQVKDISWLRENSSLPLIADEAVQRLEDISKAIGVYDGINIKLMKCTGMHEAYLMIQEAKKHNLKIMLGCMTETSCGIAAAAQLSPLVDRVDLDGNLLITNDPYSGTTMSNGKVVPSRLPGIGIKQKKTT